ncbi:MAG: bifunctional 2-C-methyl-D-erythritol 4-phosphate cytidylyltransferase/2-C-methyl-D-erythritol 2,4-cyclodiphosphate synthase [Alphaproteobacteria bacterium]|nr:bifunctional 2-C-methyl-D-erythritol 4-phosphate cytidylyltransferase/2-C-methyl-D-erythritol 2,4-cyclodiphosphate synthase [Alphaproteobacteria bacterium]
MQIPTKCAALIVAAGHGVRAGEGLPKQYRRIGGVPVLRRIIQTFANHPAIDTVQVVISAEHRDLYQETAAGISLPPPIIGGDTRQSSVLRGLDALSADSPRRVLIHDAARPLVSAALITSVVDALVTADGALPVLTASDTLKRVAGERIQATIPREGVGLAQTPQGFDFDKILRAHRAARDTNFTDDASIAEHAGLIVHAVEGSRLNFKLTTQEDFQMAEALLAGASQLRTGMGFDVHRFGPGDHVWLCGLRVPHAQGLIGHSDADVGLHALTDALLGAAALGDIGLHFPPTDERWRGAPSDIFISHAAKLIADMHGRIEHVDVTLICERPKVSPHREAMVARIAEILSLDRSRISVKATTTEGLGFTGRGEGIAAQAIATVRLP